jgi:2-C-methyl-D-erythritol 2,4-cyclodiphosphate synthase/2-C-methyl-D-erythritol 4-phosphate cytidylyltransferase
VSAPARLAVVLTAGGSGRRMGADRPKQFLSLAGQPVLTRCLRAALEWAQGAEGVDLSVLCVSHPPGLAAETRRLLESALAETGQDKRPQELKLICLPGGETRQESVRLALEALPDGLDAVFIHDGARPLATPALYERLWRALVDDAEAQGVVPLLPPGDTLKKLGADNREVTGTLDREHVRAVQTPQLFRWPLIRHLHAAACDAGLAVTDDAALLEDRTPHLHVLGVDGEARNLKLTRPEDLDMAETWVRGGDPGLRRDEVRPVPRVGQGYDVHAFDEGRPLVLGGVTIPFARGLAGHSDADVLLHAIADALLGAAALGDIGAHFPDSDERWRGADSWELLREVGRRVREAGLRPVNVDATVICEAPRIRPHAEAMRARIAAALDLPPDRVSVKGTTSEGLGFTGRGEGIAAQAVVLVLPVQY